MPSAGLRAAGFISYAPAAAAVYCSALSCLYIYIYTPLFFTVHDDACLSATPKRAIHHFSLSGRVVEYIHKEREQKQTD